MTKGELIKALEEIPDDAEIKLYGYTIQGIVYSFGEHVVAACEYHGGFQYGQKEAIIIPANDCDQCFTWFDEFSPEDAHKIKEVDIYW